MQGEEKDGCDKCDECIIDGKTTVWWEKTINVLLNEFFPNSVKQSENEFGW